MRLTPNESHYVLTTLLSQGRVRATQIRAALRNREVEIRKLREELASLESLDGAARRPRGRGRPSKPAGSPRKGRRRRPMSPRVRSLRQQQGRYMSFVRGLKPAEKSRVRAVREKEGMGAAIRLASSLAKKPS